MYKARLWAVALAVLAGTTVFANLPKQDQDPLAKPVSLSMKAASVDKVVAEIAKLLGANLEVSPQMRGEIVIVSVTDVPGRQLLDRIAATTDGLWIQDGDKMRLNRNFAAIQRQEREAIQAKTAKLRKEIKKLFDDQHNPKKPNTESNVPEMAMFGGGADAKPISELLSGIDASLIANIRGGERLVFASPNNRMQRPLSGNLNQIIGEWVAEHNKSAKNRPNTKPGEGFSEEEMAQLQEFMKIFGVSEPKTIEERPAKVIMVISNGAFGMPFMAGLMGDDSYTVDLKLYNSKGEVILRASHPLGMDFSEIEQLAESMQPKKDPPKQTEGEKDTKIEYSKPTKEMMSMFGGVTSGQMPTLSKELEALLLDPSTNDPLSFMHSEALDAIAKAKNLDLVANLPDDGVSMFGLLAEANASDTVNSYLRGLKEDESLWIKTEGTWLTISPKNPVQARATRTNRLALTKFLGQIKAEGIATLDHLAEYAQVAEHPMGTPAAQTYLMMFAPTAIQQGMGGMTDWDALRFYGTLGGSQKQTLANNGQIPYSSLNTQQRDLVAKMAFGTSAKLEIAGAAKPNLGGFMGLMMQFMPTVDKDWRQEPTEVMPDGLPNAGYVSGNVANLFIGTAKIEGMGMFDRAPLGVDELAMFQWMKEDKNFSQIAGMMPDINTVTPGTRTQYRFSFFVAKDVLFSRTLNDDRIDKNAKAVPLHDLPQSVQDEIKKKVEDMKKNPLPFMGLGGGVKPPTP